MKSIGIVTLAAGAAAALLLLKEQASDDSGYYIPNDPEENIFTPILDAITDVFPVDEAAQAEAATMASANLDNQNVQAFLWMLRVSEGTASAEGYRMLVGGDLFDSFADHPRILVDLPNLGIKSSAAGAYQILRRTWDGVQRKLGLPDFSPASQDLAAVELIRQRGALEDVKAGRFAVAVNKCKREWASLPGAGYGQRENSLNRLQVAYANAGGYVA